MPALKRPIAVALVLLAPGLVVADGASVQGTLTLDGKPLAGARVFFHQSDGAFVGGKTNENGEYKVGRVPVGTYTVTVEMAPGSKLRIPDKYASEEASGLRTEIRDGKNSVNVDLRSK